jgi:hypothetical protein
MVQAARPPTRQAEHHRRRGGERADQAVRVLVVLEGPAGPAGALLRGHLRPGALRGRARGRARPLGRPKIFAGGLGVSCPRPGRGRPSRFVGTSLGWGEPGAGRTLCLRLGLFRKYVGFSGGTRRHLRLGRRLQPPREHPIRHPPRPHPRQSRPRAGGKWAVPRGVLLEMDGHLRYPLRRRMIPRMRRETTPVNPGGRGVRW